MALNKGLAYEVYWPGNAAKTRVIRDIIQRSSKKSSVIIFDFGCGEAEHWRPILDSFTNFYLFAYDPDPRSLRKAKESLADLKAKVQVLDNVQVAQFQANYIVSFSVYEHVYNKAQYLRVAKRLLAPSGLFYLNYDDGHFRIRADLFDLRSFWMGIRAWAHNALAPILPKLGYEYKFQARVRKEELQSLLDRVGFEVLEETYGNVESIKGLWKYINTDNHRDFMEIWLSLEDELNKRFKEKTGNNYAGDDMNLWRVMASRTLVLKHKKGHQQLSTGLWRVDISRGNY